MGLYDPSHIMASAEDKAKKGELNDQLKEYIHQWREERSKEEEELKRLKEKQAKRKEIRIEQEKKLAQQKRAEEEKLRKEEAEKKEAEALEKKKALEDAERKRQEMMAAQKEKVEEEMKISLSIRIKPPLWMRWILMKLEISVIKSGTPLLCLRLTSTTMSRGSSTKTMSSKNWQRGRSCTKVELRSSGQKCLRLHGRKSLPNGQRGQRQDCQNGLAFVQAKRLEIQIPLRVRKMQLQRKMLRKKTTMRRKKKRRRRKSRSKQISLFDSLTAFLRESNHYRCTFESFHTGHCFYTKLVIA